MPVLLIPCSESNSSIYSLAEDDKKLPAIGARYACFGRFNNYIRKSVMHHSLKYKFFIQPMHFKTRWKFGSKFNER